MRRRLPALAAATIVLVAGLAVRAGSDGAFAKYAGVALYAVLVHALVVVVRPRVPPLTAAGVALAWCWAVEVAQLTPGPAALADRSTLARLVLGSTFHPPDLAWYAVGVGSALAVHRLALGRDRGWLPTSRG